MSQRLPDLPNLGYLKKQAKDVLRVSRHRSPHWRLADAQHALARGYGFPSWPDLKLHIESVRRQRAGTMPAARVHPAAIIDHGGVRKGEPAASHRDASHPIAGTWAARPGPAGDVVVEFELADDVMMLTQIVVDSTGQQSAMKMAIHVDGRDHPVSFGDELVLQSRRTDARRIETVLKHHETIVSKGTYEVSADGQSLVVSTPDTVVVFKRV
jgi:hypothetical protein